MRHLLMRVTLAVTTATIIGSAQAQIASPTVPRSTVDWDTSQADDFRTRGVPWTIK